MVAKKSAVQQPASGASAGGSEGVAEDAGGKKSAQTGPAGRAVKGAARKATEGAKKVVRTTKAAAGKAAATTAGAAEGGPAAGGTASAGASSGESAGSEAADRGAATGEAAAPKHAGDPAAGKPAAKRPAARKTAGKKATGGKAAGGTGAAEASEAVAEKGARGVAEQDARGASTTTKGATGKGTTRTGAATQDTAGSSTAKKAGAAHAAQQTGATTVGAKKTPGTATAAKTAVPKARGAAEPGELAVRPGEDPWTAEEVDEARSELMSEETRLREEITSSERSLAGLMRDSGDGAGQDEADTGSKNITREHELALAANAREMLDQTTRALERLDTGTYGLCENCGNPIGKARMQAFPRATLCVECKQKQERRY
ncbi:TraR/DksA family transcriptional regulator [Streptomyces sp. NPDC059720]|uniref:TraR/DksA family transcriptional regulator n=1 Tax=Streptomyces sp. NPDC059720 TaxID=3346924 RepID=UPI0036CB5212